MVERWVQLNIDIIPDDGIVHTHRIVQVIVEALYLREAFYSLYIRKPMPVS